MIFGLYRLASLLGAPLISLYLARRRKRGKEDPRRFAERLGHASIPRPAGPLLWVHAASVGEALSSLPLIDHLLAERPGWHVLVTSGTVTSAALMAERLPPQAVHQYVPVDRLPYVNRFLDHWKPDVALWMESEFWPNLIVETARRGTTMALLNGRVSDRSFAGWQRASGFIRGILGNFSLCLGQTPEDAERLGHLGAWHTACEGNLKFAAAPLPADPAALSTLRSAVGDRPCWLAASTHPGDEDLAWQVHRQVAEALPDLLTIIVPRHPQRGDDIATALTRAGAKTARRSQNAAPDQKTQVYIADTIGELGLFYRLAPVTFIGKSLVGAGGQNPLEPARLGSATLFGPRMDNFSAMADRMLAAGAARRVEDATALGATVQELLREPAKRTVLANAGMAFATSEADVLDRVAERLRPYLEAREAAHART